MRTTSIHRCVGLTYTQCVWESVCVYECVCNFSCMSFFGAASRFQHTKKKTVRFDKRFVVVIALCVRWCCMFCTSAAAAAARSVVCFFFFWLCCCKYFVWNCFASTYLYTEGTSIERSSSSSTNGKQHSTTLANYAERIFSMTMLKETRFLANETLTFEGGKLTFPFTINSMFLRPKRSNIRRKKNTPTESHMH